MKIIHTADIHLGSKLKSKFPESIVKERREEVRSTFKRLVDYAKNNGVEVILLSGDIFDSDHPYKKDRDFFYSVVKNNADIDFLYLKGNHDEDESYEGELPENLKPFNDEWTSYIYGDTVISGIEINGHNCTSLYSSLSLDKSKINIVMLHGATGDGAADGVICLKKLQNKNIDYLALGHIHKPSSAKLDERGVYSYCGCLEGRGFDEAGTHGFELLEIADGKLTHNFIPFAARTVNIVDVDVSGADCAYTAYTKIIGAVNFVKKDIYRVNLIGELEFDVEELEDEVKRNLVGSCYFADVTDSTVRKIDIDKFKDDLSLKGEFVRCVYADKTLDERDKLKIIAYGIKALTGVDL